MDRSARRRRDLMRTSDPRRSEATPRSRTCPTPIRSPSRSPCHGGALDALGHVNNARFFSWFESARIALFERIGVATSGPSEVGPILATTTCDFLRPVVFPATVVDRRARGARRRDEHRHRVRGGETPAPPTARRRCMRAAPRWPCSWALARCRRSASPRPSARQSARSGHFPPASWPYHRHGWGAHYASV